ncbi:MAG TPA: class I SAM-dependent methyltransferase [Thermoanaerobaculia bacterium]
MRLLRRTRNFVRKVRAGLTPFGENVSPEVPNDLFVAHLSIYAFAAPHARGGRVLDIGSGAGYGSEFLRNAGANEVIGLDLDPRNVRYAKRHYPNVAFQQADAEKLPRDLGTFDLILASNVLEHLHDVAPALETMRQMTRGPVVIAVPPIVDEASMRANEAIPYHRSNHMVERWIDMLQQRFGTVAAYRHFPRPGVQPDFSDPFPSRLTPADFLFEEVQPHELKTKETLTALFVAR